MTITFDARRSLAWLCLPVLIALFGLLVLPPTTSTPHEPATPVAAQPPGVSHLVPPHCGSLNVPWHYYTYEHGKESRTAFGPKANTADATVELRRRLCGYTAPDDTVAGGDWALLLALQGMVDNTDPNRPITLRQWQEQVWDFTERINWHSGQVVHESAQSGSLFTLYMTGKPGTQPIIHAYWKDRQAPSTYLLITVRKSQGGTVRLKLRLECGFQPVYYNAYAAPKAIM